MVFDKEETLKYIRIKNNGLIDPQALHLVGASTKRNDSTKIGQFGSGNKYALAYFLRNGQNPKVYSGTDEIMIETRRESFRGMDFDIIYLNGERTSITTEMGKDWEFWQALREIYCNAIDEGGCSIAFVPEIEPKEDQTHFYLTVGKEALAFISNFDNYFAENKKVLFECSTGRILEKSGKEANIYRKGIKCFTTNRTSVYDYDFAQFDIDENRLVKYNWQVDEAVWDLIFRCDKPEVIMNILHQSSDFEFIEGCLTEYSTINTSNMSDVFKKLLNEIRVAPRGFAGLLKPDEIHNHIIIPTRVFNAIRGSVEDKNVGDKFKILKSGGVFREVERTRLQKATIQKAMEFFCESHFEISYEIIVALFDDKEIMGAAYEKKIILSDVCIEKGVNEVVNTIIEEFIHLKYGCNDETRAFQTSIVTEFISYMKKNNSIVI